MPGYQADLLPGLSGWTGRSVPLDPVDLFWVHKDYRPPSPEQALVPDLVEVQASVFEALLPVVAVGAALGTVTDVGLAVLGFGSVM